jgi:hypothetical protein
MKYMMSKAELGKLALIQGALDGAYTVSEAARRLGLSERRVKQLKRQMREEGEERSSTGTQGNILPGMSVFNLNAGRLIILAEITFTEKVFF